LQRNAQLVIGKVSHVRQKAADYKARRLRAIDREEAAQVRKEDARNTLEGYLYRVRDLLDESNPEHPFMKCSQKSERKEIGEKLEQTIAWLHEKGDIAETSQFYDKRNIIE
jgi:hypoxia up-regulated 1